MNAATAIWRTARTSAYICNRCLIRRQFSQHLRQRQRDDGGQEAWRAPVQDGSVGQKRLTVLDHLDSRGLVNAIAGERDVLEQLLSTRQITAYVGVDPTAPSMHVGHLLPFFALFWLSLFGHNAVALVGGATASVGDPTGRTTSRAAQAKDQRETNIQHVTSQLDALSRRLLPLAERNGFSKQDFGKITVLNNSDWLSNVSIMDFLGTMGSKLRMGALLSRDTVKTKLESRDGMSFAEFTYPLLQSWDWWHLYNDHNVQLQIGGSDQFGNIVTGIDAIKNIRKPQGSETGAIEKEQPLDNPFGLTVPLLTTSAGEKFGKSAGNAIWLDKDMTPVFDLYGFFVRSADADVNRYLKLFTLLPLQRIEEIVEEHEQDASKRIAQHLLAREFVALIHGEEAAQEAERAHRSMFQRTITLPATQSSKSDIAGNHSDQGLGAQFDPKSKVTLPRSKVTKAPLAKLLHLAGLVDSRNAGLRIVQSGGAYVGSRKMVDGVKTLVWTAVHEAYKTTGNSFIMDDKFILLRIGKWNVRVINVVSDEEYRELGLPPI